VGESTAALDLGSNSFHLLVAAERDGELTQVERIKDKVQLGKGIRHGALSSDAVARGLRSIERIAQRLKGIPPHRLAVVGTSALRVADNRDVFLAPATALLGCPVRVLSGEEEAELIFLGVSHAVASDARPRLVVDVGGGSTELALGKPFDVRAVASFDLGCVFLLDRCFEGGAALATAFDDARSVARALVAAVPDVGRYRPGPGTEVIGTSGTVESVLSVLAANGWADRSITRDGLARLEDALIARKWVSVEGVPGLAPERVDIFPSGLAIVAALFDVLAIDAMSFVDASLQDGLLYDLCGRRHAEDVRARSVASWQRRFGVDVRQVARVQRTALRLLDAVEQAWALTDPRWRELLVLATDLHEAGLAVSARHPNRHGAYLVHNGDLRGFMADDRHLLALLVRGHRGGFPEFALAAFPVERARELKRLLVVLRLAVVLERTRCDEDSPAVTAAAADDRLSLQLPRGWLAAHALSNEELLREQQRLRPVGVALEINEAG